MIDRQMTVLLPDRIAAANNIELCPRRTRWQQLVLPSVMNLLAKRAAASPSLVGCSFALNATSIKLSYNSVDR
jgi:hypothetical protein